MSTKYFIESLYRNFGKLLKLLLAVGLILEGVSITPKPILALDILPLEQQKAFTFEIKGDPGQNCSQINASMDMWESNKKIWETSWQIDCKALQKNFTHPFSTAQNLEGINNRKNVRIEFCVELKDANGVTIYPKECRSFYPKTQELKSSSPLRFQFQLKSPKYPIGPNKEALRQEFTPDLADIAEEFPGTANLEPGTLVKIAPIKGVGNEPKNIGFLEETDINYDSNLIGIISSKPFEILGDNNTFLHPLPLALTGRVPAKVSNINGPIKVGDPITSSEIPGVGMKATKPGVIVGRALEDFDESEASPCPSPWEKYKCGKVLVFVNVSWNDPDVYLTDTGDLRIYEDTNIEYRGENNQSPMTNDQIMTNDQKPIFALIRKSTGEVISRIGAFAKVIVAEIKAGLVETQKLVAHKARIEEEIISPLVETEKLVTKEVAVEKITPRQGGDLVINLENDQSPMTKAQIMTNDQLPNNENQALSSESGQSPTTSRFGRLLVKGVGGKTVVSIDAAGNASFAGKLAAKQLKAEEVTAQTATVSTLIAEEIITKKGKFGEILTRKIQAVRAELEELVSRLASPSALPEDWQTTSGSSLAGLAQDWSTQPATTAAQIASDTSLPDGLVLAAQLVVQDKLSAEQAFVNQHLLVGNIAIGENGISSLTETLYLQPTGRGKVDILAGALIVEENGDVTIAGNLTVKGAIAATEYRGNSDLVFNLEAAPSPTQLNPAAGDETATAPSPTQLHSSSSCQTAGECGLGSAAGASGEAPKQSRFGRLLVKGIDGKTVVEISPEGDIVASGSATFAKINVATASAQFVVAAAGDQQTSATPSAQIRTNATAGEAVLPAGATEVAIYSDKLTPASLVYITPTSDTQNQVLYVKKKAADHFVVGINQPIEAEIRFNWWIIN